nr:unnamed protein product [Callosobruchus analis]
MKTDTKKIFTLLSDLFGHLRPFFVYLSTY